MPVAPAHKQQGRKRICEFTLGVIFQLLANLHSSFGTLELQKARGVIVLNNNNRTDMSKYFGHVLYS